MEHAKTLQNRDRSVDQSDIDMADAETKMTRAKYRPGLFGTKK